MGLEGQMMIRWDENKEKKKDESMKVLSIGGTLLELE